MQSSLYLRIWSSVVINGIDRVRSLRSHIPLPGPLIGAIIHHLGVIYSIRFDALETQVMDERYESFIRVFNFS